jgi:hypothetical protein
MWNMEGLVSSEEASKDNERLEMFREILDGPIPLAYSFMGKIITTLATEGELEGLEICLQNDQMRAAAIYRGNCALNETKKKYRECSEEKQACYLNIMKILRQIPEVAELEIKQEERFQELSSLMSDCDISQESGEKRRRINAEGEMEYPELKKNRFQY